MRPFVIQTENGFFLKYWEVQNFGGIYTTVDMQFTNHRNSAEVFYCAEHAENVIKQIHAHTPYKVKVV